MDEQNPPMKRCTGPCGQEYPATTKYFHRNSQQRNGLDPRCKKCKGARNKLYYERSEVQEHRKEYYNRQEIQERDQSYRKEYYRRPEVKEKAQRYRKRPEVRQRLVSYQREYSERPSVKEYQKEYRRTPRVRERSRIASSNRSARKKSVQGTYTSQQIQELLKRQKNKCYYCQKRLQKGKDKYIYHIEHTFPLSRVAGTDIPANSIDYIVLACPTCNMAKGDKFPWEWPEGGRLF